MGTTTPASCVIGFPARHSRSPKLHGYWLDKYGINGAYRIEEIPPEAVDAFISDLAGHGYVGANVTMPHKDAAFRLSQPDEKARAIGAANTLWLDDGVLRATNTDGDGYVASLDVAAPGWCDKVALVGGGGANVHVVNRTAAKANAMRETFGSGVKPAAWDDVPSLLEHAGLLVNTTSLGMHGQPPLEIDLAPLATDAIVSDIVYVPLQTPLLAAAMARGLTTSDGLEMLIHQAVRGFELWFGLRPEVTQEQYDMMAVDLGDV